jgi:hypothetical protein
MKTVSLSTSTDVVIAALARAAQDPTVTSVSVIVTDGDEPDMIAVMLNADAAERRCSEMNQASERLGKRYDRAMSSYLSGRRHEPPDYPRAAAIIEVGDHDWSLNRSYRVVKLPVWRVE